MLKESFLDLIEIQSIQKKIEALNLKIEDEKGRISDLQKQFKLREDNYLEEKQELKQVDSDLLEKELNLIKIDKKLVQAKINQKKVTSQKEANALEDEIFSLGKNKKELEDLIFTLLENQEILKNNLFDFETFKEGFQKTILNIQNEIDEKIKLELNEINNFGEREKNLLSLLPKDLQNTFLGVSKRYKTKSLTFIEQGKCGACRMSIPSMITQEVENQTTVETCPNCGRILLPHGIT